MSSLPSVSKPQWKLLLRRRVTIESLIAEAEAARAKAMSEKGGSAAAVSALTAKAKLAGMWREKLDQHNTGSPVYESIERVIVERAPQSAPASIPDECSVIVFSAGNRLSWLLASHPLQVRAGYNQLQPLFVTMADRELLHARR